MELTKKKQKKVLFYECGLFFEDLRLVVGMKTLDFQILFF